MADPKLHLGLLTDNRRWDMVENRPDDVIVVTPPKCGTTWMQTIVALLLSSDPDVETELSVKMPWVDIRIREMPEVAARLDAMTQRRSMKSHTPIDGLPLEDQAQYICVFRHPLDAHFSYRKHVRNIPMSWFDTWYPEIARTNPLERVNREVKRRADVIGIFPNDAAILRLVGALMLETNDEWAVARRYMSLETLARVTDNPTIRLPAVAS